MRYYGLPLKRLSIGDLKNATNYEDLINSLPTKEEWEKSASTTIYQFKKQLRS